MNKYENKYIDYFQYEPVPEYFLQKQPEPEIVDNIPEKRTMFDNVMFFVRNNNNAKLIIVVGGIFLLGFFVGKSSR